MSKQWHWELDETGEDLQYTSTETGDHHYPLCPICGTETHYCYGQVDMNQMGDAINAEWYACHRCGISTPLEYED